MQSQDYCTGACIARFLCLELLVYTVWECVALINVFIVFIRNAY